MVLSDNINVSKEGEVIGLGSRIKAISGKSLFKLSELTVQNTQDNLNIEEVLKTITFNPDGTKLHVSSQLNEVLEQYSLSTPWDITTAGTKEVTIDVSSWTSRPNMAWNDDGTRLLVSDPSSGKIRDFTVSKAYDLTSTLTQQNEVTSLEAPAEDGYVARDGSALFHYAEGATTGKLFKYPFNTPWDVSTLETAAPQVQTWDISDVDGDNPGNIVAFTRSGKYVYLRDGGNTLHEYELPSSWDISKQTKTGRTLTLSEGPSCVDFFEEQGYVYFSPSSQIT